MLSGVICVSILIRGTNTIAQKSRSRASFDSPVPNERLRRLAGVCVTVISVPHILLYGVDLGTEIINDKAVDIIVCRIIYDIFRCVELYELCIVHYHHTVGHGKRLPPDRG